MWSSAKACARRPRNDVQVSPSIAPLATVCSPKRASPAICSFLHNSMLITICMHIWAPLPASTVGQVLIIDVLIDEDLEGTTLDVTSDPTSTTTRHFSTLPPALRHSVAAFSAAMIAHQHHHEAAHDPFESTPTTTAAAICECS